MDNLLLIVVAVVVGLILFNVVGALFGLVWFLIKLALATAVIAATWRLVAHRRDRELGGRNRDHELHY
ncbi:MAG: hypothetical protein QOG03_1086 [Actinomycetota bacterium]|jgi:uncharacterized membrane protein YuzA (DUF378 family)|nr:hypothetical protein [Actinomycetota bacterium]